MKNTMSQKFPFRAFVLAGGLGSRLKSVVSDRPKPMAMVGEKPFLEILIGSLVAKGVNRIVLLTGYMSEFIEDYVRKYESADVEILISREETPMGTGGAVKHAQRLATDPVLLVNGDTFFEADIARLYQFHEQKGSLVTLSLCRVDDVGRYGSVFIDNDGLVMDFREKNESVKGEGLINAGFSIISLDLIKDLPDAGGFSMEKEIFPTLIPSRRMYALEQKGAFFDIGTPESYADFTEYLQDQRKNYFTT